MLQFARESMGTHLVYAQISGGICRVIRCEEDGLIVSLFGREVELTLENIENVLISHYPIKYIGGN